jgi:hypothetical protein
VIIEKISLKEQSTEINELLKRPQTGKIFNHKSAIAKPATGIEYDLPSMTVPDQSLPLRELYKRHVRGGEMSVLKPQYMGDDELPDIEKLDKIERIELAKAVTQEIQNTRASLLEKKAQKDKDDAEKQKAKQTALNEKSTQSGGSAPDGGGTAGRSSSDK